MSHRPLPRDRRLLQRTGAMGRANSNGQSGAWQGWELAARLQGAAQQQAVGAQRWRFIGSSPSAGERLARPLRHDGRSSCSTMTAADYSHRAPT